MTIETTDAYDVVAYPTLAYDQTHPDRSATLATLFGMNPADVEHCRILEMGCGEGGNLIPLAIEFPHSQFLGIDRAETAIDKGSKAIKDLGLTNIELRKADLMETSSELGKFDYIIAHGVFSWIPDEVQDQMLAICRSCLSPDGVAYISYNTYPGCYLRRIPREMMLFHTKGIEDPNERLVQGCALIKWLTEGQAKPESDAYQVLLRETQEHYEKKAIPAIYHDDLAEVNTPLYFHQFIERAAKYGLKFLSEAEGFIAVDSKFTPNVAQQLHEIGEQDIVAREQYVDFLRGRSFRQTLLCHHEINLDRSINVNRIKNFYMSSEAKPVSATPDLKSEAVEEFRGPKSSLISTSFPLAKAAICYLGEIYPRSAQFEEIFREAGRRLGIATSSGDLNSDEQAKALAELLLKSYGAGIVHMHLYLPKAALSVSEKPLASALARLQARQGRLVTNLFHVNIKLEDDLGLQLLLLLDGTRDRPAIIRDLTTIIQESFQAIPEQEKENFYQRLPLELEEKLVSLGNLGLLSA